jgi:tRNA(fMet)-specific endonuclease VapC
MESRYLLDTNIASCAIKGRVSAVEHRLRRVPMAQVAVSAVTEAELRYGVARLPSASRLHEIVDEFLIRTTVLPWDSGAAQHYGILRAALEAEGQPMGALDTMIAAHALSQRLVLVTNDRAFGRIPKLKIQDWTK